MCRFFRFCIFRFGCVVLYCVVLGRGENGYHMSELNTVIHNARRNLYIKSNTKITHWVVIICEILTPPQNALSEFLAQLML